MHITQLCSAGLAITYQNATLLIDVPNEICPPFYALPEETWKQILERNAPYDKVCGLVFTHTHPDHCDLEKVRNYQARWPDICCFLPENHAEKGTVICGPFVISYERIDHAPMEGAVPPLVVLWIRAGDKSVYIASDAKLDCAAHQGFLKGRKANIGFWISSYMSRPDTRSLMEQTAQQNYIYHMPKERPDGQGLWKKCDRNFQRYADELKTVTVPDRYPFEIVLD